MPADAAAANQQSLRPGVEGILCFAMARQIVLNTEENQNYHLHESLIEK